MQEQPATIRGRWRVAAGTLLALSAAAAASTLLVWHGPDAAAGAPAARAAAPAPIPVATALVVQREVNAWHEFSGRLEAVDRVVIRSRVAGTIQQVHFREGALVRQGELLILSLPLLTGEMAPHSHGSH